MGLAGVDPNLLRASLLGGAIGDSLGAEIEFWSLAQIRAQFPKGIQEPPPHDGIVGAITDDTQMTLFTVEGLIEAYDRGMLRGIWHPPSHVHEALLRWLVTQGGKPRVEVRHRGLMVEPILNVRRAPGLTCLSALEAATDLGKPARNNSKGCGTIMRVAPVALMLPQDMVRGTAIACSALTHEHPTGQLAAAAWAELLRYVAQGDDLEASALQIADEYRALTGGDETAQAITAALSAPRDGQAETVEILGGGWVAEEALAIALYACLAGRGFEDALRIAVTTVGIVTAPGRLQGTCWD
ncbi:MAG: ADP-ribosylglycohydrolase family protein [Nitrospiraceae bacterium]|nr:ADP-ribosylglycohydrolase family protein [Nitrospiraceae bacterium]